MGLPNNYLLKAQGPSKVKTSDAMTFKIVITEGLMTETVARVREYILSNPDIYNDTSKSITGGGWDHTIWPTTIWPTSVRPTT